MPNPTTLEEITGREEDNDASVWGGGTDGDKYFSDIGVKNIWLIRYRARSTLTAVCGDSVLTIALKKTTADFSQKSTIMILKILP